MNDFNRAFTPSAGAGSMDMSVNEGLRAFMLGVYQKLAYGIALAGGLAFLVGSNTVPALTEFVLFSPFRLVVQFGPIALILISAFTMKRPSPLGTAVLYWTIVTLLGLSLSVAGVAAGRIRAPIRAGQTARWQAATRHVRQPPTCAASSRPHKSSPASRRGLCRAIRSEH